MYIEETGAADDPIGHGDIANGDIANGDIQIDGPDGPYSAEANHDFDGDGVEEAARVTTEHGFTDYVDEDHDGRADLVRTSDHGGAVLDESRFDPAAGRWLPEEPAPAPPLAASAPPAPSLVIDTPQGNRDIGPATEDTNGNGRPDTAVVDESRGMLLATDMDGDASADQVARIEDTGAVTVSRHVGPGQWAVVEQHGVGQDAPGAAGEPVPGGNPAPSSTDDGAWDLGEPTPPGVSPAQPAPAQPAPAQPAPAQQASGAPRPDEDALWA